MADLHHKFFVSHKLKQGPCHPKGSQAEAMSGHCQPMDELEGSSYHPLVIFWSLPAQGWMFRYLTHKTAPLSWESRAVFLVLPFSVTFVRLTCRPAPPDGVAQDFPKKKSFLPAEGVSLVSLLENYRHLDTCLWVFGIEINWTKFCCSYWVEKSPFIQLTAVPSHLPQYLFTDSTLKTSQPQKKFFLERMQHCLGRQEYSCFESVLWKRKRWVLVLSEWQLNQKNGKVFTWCWAKRVFLGILLWNSDALFKLKGDFST